MQNDVVDMVAPFFSKMEIGSCSILGGYKYFVAQPKSAV